MSLPLKHLHSIFKSPVNFQVSVLGYVKQGNSCFQILNFVFLFSNFENFLIQNANIKSYWKVLGVNAVIATMGIQKQVIYLSSSSLDGTGTPAGARVGGSFLE